MSKKRNKKTDIKGNMSRPRLSVHRSNLNISAQIIDDENGVTLASAGSLKAQNGGCIAGAVEVGKLLGKAAAEKKIKSVVFDRGRYQYKGRVKALADSARETGLEF
ncbi:MAG: large subunit ribosomal protein L18 [Candidatus Marinamargulisbacteria bacterium]|jgi:large subunit ribosomal protein L18